MSTDLRLLRNSDEFKIKYWNSKFPTINDLHTVVQDDNSVTDIETKKPLFNFKEIDDDPDNKDNKCLMQYNNYENIKFFKGWHKETGTNRECCYRFTTDKQQIEH